MKIALIGYGKMGKEIEKIALKRGHSVSAIIDTHNISEINSLIKNVDIAIEFTRPESAIENIKVCINEQVPVVVGTTGWYNDFDEIKKMVSDNNGSLFYATNYSIGVNVFFDINRKLAELMNPHPEYDVEIEEIHHTQKLDAPSGTAITLAEGVLSEFKRKKKWINEKASDKEELSIISVRKDAVPGTHIIKYKSEIDSIEIKHTANNRIGFASGAVIAAEWLVSKKGVYTMKDMLGL
jgi:4-hydroxy-tetrahydrodipicolinate reductase